MIKIQKNQNHQKIINQFVNKNSPKINRLFPNIFKILMIKHILKKISSLIIGQKINKNK